MIDTARRERIAALRGTIEKRRTAGTRSQEVFYRYEADPIGFVEGPLHEHLWSKQQEIAQSVVDHKFTAVPSCHGPGKSFIASRLAAWWLSSHPPGTAMLVSTAPTFPQVRAILWREIGIAHRKAGLPGRVNLTEWHIGQELVGFGRKPSDYNEAAFQGIHAEFVLVVIDEACGVPRSIWNAAESLTTTDGSRILAVGNPDDPTSEFAKVCKKNSGWHVVSIDALETPNLTGEEVPPEVAKVLVSAAWVEERKHRWGEESPLYRSKVRGLFPDRSTDSLIPLSWIEAACARETAPTGKAVLGVDVARSGTDETVIGRLVGQHYRMLDSYVGQDTMVTTGKVMAAIREGALEARVDVIGIGAGVVDRLDELGAPVLGLNVAAGTTDPALFANARAEWYWQLRDAFDPSLDSQMDIDPEDEALAEQLSEIRFTLTSKGKIQIESKDDMRKRGVSSPDRADAMMLAVCTPATDEEWIVEEPEDSRIEISRY